jgi:phosphatidate cytidylyltransferase
MNKIAKRLIVFFIGVPALFSALLLFPWRNHLLFNLVTIVFTVLGAAEFRTILARKNLVIPMPLAVVLGAVVPASWTAVISLGVTEYIVGGAFILSASLLFVSQIFVNQGKFDSCMGRICAGFSILIYPGFFMAWIVRMSVFSEAGVVILFFFLVVFLNDAMAWIAGNLFGKNNRGLIPASPGKSIAGFIGGLAASVGTGILAVILFPGAFAAAELPPVLSGVILGFGPGIASILGDLGESAIKRSADMKDSGNLILGRGGALDSIDSLIFAAPVYHILYQVLFQI